MDLNPFPVDTLIGISGPIIAPFPPDPGEDYESWWAQTGPDTAIPVPVAVIREMQDMSPSGRAWEWRQGQKWDDAMEIARQRLNTAVQRVKKRLDQ